MILLMAGVALWWAAHLFKRLAPGARAGLGDPGRGAVALLLLASVVLMVVGYRDNDGAMFWGPSRALVGVNNLLMFVAVYLFAVSGPGAGKPRVWLGTKLRHPMLLGFAVWAASHLLVNGDVASFILFGGLLLWVPVQMAAINRAVPDWTPPPRGKASKEAAYIVLTLLVMTVVMLIHNWLGVRPWG